MEQFILAKINVIHGQTNDYTYNSQNRINVDSGISEVGVIAILPSALIDNMANVPLRNTIYLSTLIIGLMATFGMVYN